MLWRLAFPSPSRCVGGAVSLGSLVGFAKVLGGAARNGIMMVSHFRHLEAEEGMPFGKDLVVRGAMERVVPIAMTALATGLALVPLVMAGGSRGVKSSIRWRCDRRGALYVDLAEHATRAAALLRLDRSVKEDATDETEFVPEAVEATSAAQ